MQGLTQHLHDFIREVEVTEAEWNSAIEILTATGHITDDRRQEFVLWSDALGISMVVDAVANQLPPGATESTVLGPFHADGAPLREYGDTIAEKEDGPLTWVNGRVLNMAGEPLAGAVLDIWQNGSDRLYAVQDPNAPERHLTGKFETREDGSYGFVAVSPVPYPIPDDGPVGNMLEATGRHPWRPAHIHARVSAPGYRTVTTHFFDRQSKYLDDDAVFAVKESLLCDFVPHSADDPDRPALINEDYTSVTLDVVLASEEG